VNYVCNADNQVAGPPYILQGDEADPRFTWAEFDGQRYELGWPIGYSARFPNTLQVLNDSGTVVAVAANEYGKICPTADPNVWLLDLSSLVQPKTAPNN
jgi:hypothetical protein